MIDNDLENIYISCECHTHLLEVTKNKEEKETYFSFYSYGHTGDKYSFKEALRLIWKLLRTGTPYSDSITINEDEKLKLVNFLLKK